MSEPITLRRQASPRLVAVSALAMGGLFGGILAGHPELVAVGSPFALLLVAAIVLAERPDLRVAVTSESDRVVSGDDIELVITLKSSVPLGRVSLWLPRRGHAEVVDPSDGTLAWVARVGTAPAEIKVRLRTARWGVETFGPLRLEVAGPLGLVRWLGGTTSSAVVRVLPDDGTLKTLLPNPEPRATSGAHIAPRRGDGFEFAEVRQYREGDRLRSVNWYQSARRGELWVNEHHPERSGDLVVLVDTFADRRSGGSASLERSVRVAWQVAMTHLGAHDRVGIVGFGGLASWVLPGGGERARLTVIDRLLDSHASWNEAQRSVWFLPRQIFPAGAQVIAVTGLHDERMTVGIADVVRRGHDTSVVVIVPEQPPSPVPPSDVIVLARRLWRLEIRERRRELERLGIPVVAISGDDPSQVLALARAAAPDSAVIVTAPRARVVVRWGTAAGAGTAAVFVVILAASVASADGRRGAVVLGIAGVVLLGLGLVASSGVYPGALVALGASFAFSLAGNELAPAAVIGATALLLLLDQLVAWSFDAATGALERGPAIGARLARIVVIVAVGAGVSALVLSAGGLPVPGGLAAEAIGIAAALGVIGLVASRRWGD